MINHMICITQMIQMIYWNRLIRGAESFEAFLIRLLLFDALVILSQISFAKNQGDKRNISCITESNLELTYSLRSYSMRQ
jgi:hypothetical protein